jgi:hypothetical protein
VVWCGAVWCCGHWRCFGVQWPLVCVDGCIMWRAAAGDGVGGQGGGGGGSSGAKKPQQSPIGGRLGKVLQQRKRGSKDRFGGMSVEGRGIQL